MKFTVEGRGRFPYDMLRYDRCFPASSADSSMIDPGWGKELIREVTLRTDQGKHFQPAAKRWESFGWRLIDK